MVSQVVNTDTADPNGGARVGQRGVGPSRWPGGGVSGHYAEGRDVPRTGARSDDRALNVSNRTDLCSFPADTTGSLLQGWRPHIWELGLLDEGPLRKAASRIPTTTTLLPTATTMACENQSMSEAIIRLTRRAVAFRDRARSYRVELNGEVIGKIRSGQSTDFRVEPGHHRLRIKADWTGSQILSFDIQKSEVVCFECQPNGHSIVALVEVFKSLGKPGRPWVDLREVSGEETE